MTSPATQPTSTGSISRKLHPEGAPTRADWPIRLTKKHSAPGASASTVLQPKNFDNLLLELASVSRVQAGCIDAPSNRSRHMERQSS